MKHRPIAPALPCDPTLPCHDPSRPSSYGLANQRLYFSSQASSGGSVALVTIIGSTFFGARHALETLSQLVEYNDQAGAFEVTGGLKAVSGVQYNLRRESTAFIMVYGSITLHERV